MFGFVRRSMLVPMNAVPVVMSIIFSSRFSSLSLCRYSAMGKSW